MVRLQYLEANLALISFRFGSVCILKCAFSFPEKRIIEPLCCHTSRSSPSSLTHTEDVQVRVLFLDDLLCFGGFEHGTSILYSNVDGSLGS